MARNIFRLRYEASAEPVLVPAALAVPESAGWDFQVIRPYVVPPRPAVVVDPTAEILASSVSPKRVATWDVPPTRPFPQVPLGRIVIDPTAEILASAVTPTRVAAWDVPPTRPLPRIPLGRIVIDPTAEVLASSVTPRRVAAWDAPPVRPHAPVARPQAPIADLSWFPIAAPAPTTFVEAWDATTVRPSPRIPTSRETIADLSWFPIAAPPPTTFVEAWDALPTRSIYPPAIPRAETADLSWLPLLDRFAAAWEAPRVRPLPPGPIPRTWIEDDLAWFPIAAPAPSTFVEAWDALTVRPLVPPPTQFQSAVIDQPELFIIEVVPPVVPAEAVPPAPLSGPFIPMREFFAQEVFGSATFAPELLGEAHGVIIVDGGGLARLVAWARARGVRIEPVDGGAEFSASVYSTAKGRIRVGAPHVEREDAQVLGLDADRVELGDDDCWKEFR